MIIDYESLRDTSLDYLKNYMDSLNEDKGRKLAYWIADYVRMLKQEKTFIPSKLIKYKRGSIVKVHLGYRVGSEEGGLHYAIVMDHDNSIHSPTVTVIPLTSIKPGVDLSSLPRHRVSIGNEVYTLLTANFNAEIRTMKRQLLDLKALLESTDEAERNPEQESIIDARMEELEDQIEYCKKMNREVGKMKVGSIALVGQITTISKIRIYDPRYSKDALSKIRVSSDTLDILDARVQELYGSLQNNDTP